MAARVAALADPVRGAMAGLLGTARRQLGFICLNNIYVCVMRQTNRNKCPSLDISVTPAAERAPNAKATHYGRGGGERDAGGNHKLAFQRVLLSPPPNNLG